jgi:hypothetical protein
MNQSKWEKQSTYAALRQPLIPSSATLFFGLKTIAKTDPTPKPTKKKVMAGSVLSPLGPRITAGCGTQADGVVPVRK